MPWLGANGLLPGRGWFGRGAGRGEDGTPGPDWPPSRAAGTPRGAWVCTGRGPGAGAAGAGAAGRAGAGLTEAATRAGASTGAAGAGRAGATGAGPADDGTTAAAGTDVDGADDAPRADDAALGAGAEGAAFPAEALSEPPTRSSAGNVSLMLRTTGGSMVDDADRTNSPFSFR